VKAINRRTLFFVIAAGLALLIAAGWRYYVRQNAYTSRETETPPPADKAVAPLQERAERLAAPRSEAEWCTYHGDSALRGVADVVLPEKLAILWRFKAGAPVRETPVVHDRRVFFATARGEVIAIDLNAQRLWSQELFTGEGQKGVPVRERIEAPPACMDDLVLVGTSRGMLYAFHADSGKEKWHTQLEGPILGTPNYLRAASEGQSSRVYVIDRAKGVLQCVDSNSGGVIWRSEEIQRCDGSPAVSADAVVFGSCAMALHVFSPDTGKLLRNIELGEDSQVAGGVALDGDLVVSGSRSGKVLEADVKTGKILWENTASENEVFSTPAVTKEWVVAASTDGNVFALERGTGALRWRFDTKGMPSSPVIAGDKVVVAADGELFLLRLADGTKLWSLKVSDEITSPAIAEQMVIVGSEDGTVVALGAAQEQGEAGTP
jgi:outer membrane protein assembly factor BamB